MQIRTLTSLDLIPADQWNALVRNRNPFLRHEFLVALERHHCVGERNGWLPCHLVCLDNGRLLGAAPLYLKHNFYGEFVFDHTWEAAYERHGLPYYPKLVSAIPYTPATGQRLLLAAGQEHDVADALVAQALQLVASHRCSSLHWLFPDSDSDKLLTERGMLQRLGCQFHWQNRGYRDFTDFLDTFTAKKRKNVRHERRSVQAAGLELQIIKGNTASPEQWELFHRFYCATFERRWGYPTLTLPFFREIGATMGEQIVLILARDGSRDVAGAICFQSDDTLYGRHWGCIAEYDNLHFETCYYQGIEYCIREGLQRFEPGAQGEHKISRGFLPTFTYSAHHLAHPPFQAAIADFLRREKPAVQAHARELGTHSPYRQEPVA